MTLAVLSTLGPGTFPRMTQLLKNYLRLTRTADFRHWMNVHNFKSFIYSYVLRSRDFQISPLYKRAGRVSFFISCKVCLDGWEGLLCRQIIRREGLRHELDVRERRRFIDKSGVHQKFGHVVRDWWDRLAQLESLISKVRSNGLLDSDYSINYFVEVHDESFQADV